MASELKVDKFTGVTTAGSIDVVGEGNSTTTNLQQGLAKVWSNLGGITFGLRGSFNVSSATDQGTGDYDITFSNNMANDDYSSVATGDGSGVADITKVDTSQGRSSSPTTFCSLSTKQSSGVADLRDVYLNIHGDLA